jgi:hypothetical protein
MAAQTVGSEDELHRCGACGEVRALIVDLTDMSPPWLDIRRTLVSHPDDPDDTTLGASPAPL